MLEAPGGNCPISLTHQLLLLNAAKLLHICRRLRETGRDRNLQNAYDFALHIINTADIPLKPFNKL